ncbi:MAG: universal stress protein [Calothrix sp. FI2-JRJ7]|jgi:nucleotide-binding universal stress UspA family protein|nr:universal stress protein [Calothrix sp. FI2-JRJ7]
MHSKILVAVENNQIGEAVFNEALSMAKTNGACLMLLHVTSPFEERYVNPISIDPYSFYPTMHSEAILQSLKKWDALKQECTDFLMALSQRAASYGISAEFTQNLGDPGRIICDMARNWQADLIIVGRRGRVGLSEFFLGSVSNYVLHHAHCSVLTVQGTLKNTEETLAQSCQIAGTTF